MKKINCTFMMSGTYDLETNSVYNAWIDAKGNLPLPTDKRNVEDSLVVNSLGDCMVANGWTVEEVEDLSCLTKEELTQEIDRRHALGIEEIGNEGYTTTRLKEFLLDYYGITYNFPEKPQLQPEQSAPQKDVFAVLCTKNHNIDIKVFDTIEDAKEVSVNHPTVLHQAEQNEKMQ